jgi:hypothetical protein
VAVDPYLAMGFLPRGSPASAVLGALVPLAQGGGRW